MLETLISSKIRRALFEYILTHAAHRFYLRGLAKELSLSVSPLRRELKRLESLGVLKAYEEANVRFYIVDETSPQFAQLKSAVTPSMQIASPAPASPATNVAAGRPPPGTHSPTAEAVAPGGAEAVQPPEPLAAPAGVVASTVISHPQIERIRRATSPSLSLPMLLGVVSLGLFVVLLAGGITYLTITNQHLLSLTKSAVSAPRANVTVVESGPKPAGEMRSSRWRLMPGAMGGFSNGSAEERRSSQETY